MSKIFKPQSYQDWINELNFATKDQEMVKAAINAIQLAADKGTARHDIALVLAAKYKKDMDRTANNAMLVRAIDERYEIVAQSVFKSKFQSLINYVIKTEPDFLRRFDPVAKAESDGKTPLGFIKPAIHKNEDGSVRLPLGFMKSHGREDDKGNIEPGLGFLSAD